VHFDSVRLDSSVFSTFVFISQWDAECMDLEKFGFSKLGFSAF
jgi:hypothetical protein